MAEELLTTQLQMAERILKELHIPKYIRKQYPKVTPTGEQWRREYNQVRPHSALRYRPPAPEAIMPVTLTQ